MKNKVRLDIIKDFHIVNMIEVEYPKTSNIHDYVLECIKTGESFDMIVVDYGRMILVPVKESVVFVMQRNLKDDISYSEYKLLNGSSVYDLGSNDVLEKLGSFVEGEKCIDKGSAFFNTSVKFEMIDWGKSKSLKLIESYTEKMKTILDEVPKEVGELFKKQMNDYLLYGEVDSVPESWIKKIATKLSLEAEDNLWGKVPLEDLSVGKKENEKPLSKIIDNKFRAKMKKVGWTEKMEKEFIKQWPIDQANAVMSCDYRDLNDMIEQIKPHPDQPKILIQYSTFGELWVDTYDKQYQFIRFSFDDGRTWGESQDINNIEKSLFGNKKK